MTFDVDQLRARHAHCAPAICDTLRACNEIDRLRGQTSPDLAAIRARCEAALPGPWEWVERGDSCGELFSPCPTPPGGWCAVLSGSGFDTDVDYGRQGNADFIAHARTDVPALLAEIERLRTIVAALTLGDEPDSCLSEANMRAAFVTPLCAQSVECGAKNDPGERSQHSPGPADPQIPTGRIDNRGE